jgi:hypothetical protein
MLSTIYGRIEMKTNLNKFKIEYRSFLDFSFFLPVMISPSSSQKRHTEIPPLSRGERISFLSQTKTFDNIMDYHPQHVVTQRIDPPKTAFSSSNRNFLPRGNRNVV